MENNNLDSNTLIEVSTDGMLAYLTLMPSLDDVFDYSKVAEEIKSVIKFGLKEEVIKRMLDDEVYFMKNCIAEGIRPIDEKDGYIKYYFNLKKDLVPKVKEDGTVDYRELDMINNVHKGDILAELILPTEGKEGRKVTGEVVDYKKGKIPFLKFGKNVNISEDGMYLITEKDGLVRLSNDKVIVNEVLEILSIDNSTGNISFNGGVIVKGSVLTGFELKAQQDIEIRGVVEGALVESCGNILIKKGIQGYNRGKLISKNNIIAKFIENSFIHCDEDLTVEAIMHSEVICNGSINVIGKKGLIVGGICRARKEICAKTIGSSMATTTLLEVGVDPNLKIKYEQVKKQIKDMKLNLNKVNKSLILLENLIECGRIDDNKKQMYNKLIMTKENLSNNLNKMNREYMKTKIYIDDLSRGQVRVENIIYPGVKITIGNSVLFVREELKHCTIYRENGEIKIGSY